MGGKSAFAILDQAAGHYDAVPRWAWTPGAWTRFLKVQSSSPASSASLAPAQGAGSEGRRRYNSA
jgi:hypothetical protein